MAENEQILHQAINEGLLSLGEPIMKTIKWHLAARGLFLDSIDQIDIRIFHNHLEEIVGNIADVVLNDIYENLSARSDLSTGNIRSSESVVVKIEQLMKVQGREGKGTK